MACRLAAGQQAVQVPDAGAYDRLPHDAAGLGDFGQHGGHRVRRDFEVEVMVRLENPSFGVLQGIPDDLGAEATKVRGGAERAGESAVCHGHRAVGDFPAVEPMTQLLSDGFSSTAW